MSRAGLGIIEAPPTLRLTGSTLWSRSRISDLSTDNRRSTSSPMHCWPAQKWT